MPLWVPITIAAAFLQNLRSALQKNLKGQMGTTGATFARFGFGFPFALVYLAVLHWPLALELPRANPTFFLAVVVGGAAQIGGTFLLVWLFSFRNFMVGTAYSKTEPVQAALFGLIILGERISLLGFVAIVIGVIGVAVISLSGAGGSSWRAGLFSRAAGIGVLSGALFGVAAVGARWASLSLDGGEAIIRAGFALAFVTGFQTSAMLLWMAAFDRDELRAVGRAWRPSLLVGMAGVAGSAGWFTAMTLEKVAYVRALGQIELIFTYASSVLFFRETIRRGELLGCLLILAAILTLLGAV